MVRAVMIIEIAGQPAEYVKERLEKHVSTLKSMKEVNVNSMSISEPKELEDEKGFFTCFSEIDFEARDLIMMSEIMFDLMPSSIEVLEPSKVNLNTNEATSLLNNISGRMHRYDKIASMAQNKVGQLAKQLELSNKLMVEKGILEIKDGKLVLTEKEKQERKETQEKNQDKSKEKNKKKNKKSKKKD